MFCLKCNLAITANEKFIKCDGCNRSVHTNNCSELTSAELKSLELRPSSKRRIKYICVDCEQGVHQIPKLISLINDLKDEIRIMKENYSALIDSRSVHAPSDALASEEIINEVMERNIRSNNIIVYGVPEQGRTKQEQLELDTVLIGGITTELGLTEETIKPVRLGRFDRAGNVRSRPMKVRLSTADAVQNVLRKFHKLKSSTVSGQYSSINVTPDRTPKQIAFYKALKSELDGRVQGGERNLKIRYRNGIPRIICSEN